MDIVSFEKLNREEQEIVGEAKKTAGRSISIKQNFVGAVILGTRGGVYRGATIGRTRAIGSTCSERMAMDQLYYSGCEKPRTVCTIGTFERHGWSDSFICTPCGVCLEMFLESMKHFDQSSIDFVCSSWDMSRILRCTINDLLPQFGKGDWKRNDAATLQKS